MSLSVAVITPPSGPAVSTEDAKKHLNVTHADDDNYIAALVEAATHKVESETSRRLVSQSLRYTVDSFFCEGGYQLVLPVWPITSVTAVKYIDTTGVQQTWAPSLYLTDLDNEPARLAPAFGQIFPITQPRIAAGWVEFTAGYASPEDVPAGLLQALLLLVGTYYENRESVVVGAIAMELPNSVEWLLRGYRLFPAAG